MWITIIQVAPPSMLESLLFTGQIDNYCNHIENVRWACLHNIDFNCFSSLPTKASVNSHWSRACSRLYDLYANNEANMKVLLHVARREVKEQYDRNPIL